MHAWSDDLRFAFRILSRQKLLTLVAAATLALGIGANTAIFSTVSGILWNTLPYPESERLAAIWGANPKMGFNQASVSFRDIEDWRAVQSFERVSAWRFFQVSLSGSAEPRSTLAVESDAELFEVLREKAALGRTYDDNERQPGEHRAAIITESLWRRDYAADPGILGRDIRLDGANYTVIGIMPPGFTLLYSDAEVFIPLRLTPEQKTNRDTRGLRALARLVPGHTITQADAELQTRAKAIEATEPEAYRGWTAHVSPLELDVIDKGARMSIETMFWAVMGVLLIACANLAALLLARGALRQRELAIRASMGAGQGRIIRLLLTESLTLSFLGGILGAGFAAWAIPVLRSIAPEKFPRLEFVQLDPKALLYTFLLCVTTGLIAGLAPAWLLSRGELASTLREGGRGGTFSRQRLLQSLVTAEVALAMVLLTVTGLLVRSLIGQIYGDPGFDRTHLVTAVVTLPKALYAQDREQAEFHRAAIAALRRDSRIQSASVVQSLPLGGSNTWYVVDIEGRALGPNERNMAGFLAVLPGYFNTLGVPVLEGRDLSDTDSGDTLKVAVINQTMARRFWPDDPHPVGRRFRAGGPNDPGPYLTVVGICRDVRHQGPAFPPRPEMFVPITQTSSRRMIYLARTNVAPARAADAVRDAIWSVDRNQPISDLQTMDELIDRRLAGPRVTAQILGFLAALALLLAGLGIYGVLSYLTSQRAREIGIRVALGAVPVDIVQLVLRRGFLLSGLGLAIGLACAAATAPLIRNLLAGIQPHDTTSFLLSGGSLLAVALFACAFPVVRALRTDPVSVLREE